MKARVRRGRDLIALLPKSKSRGAIGVAGALRLVLARHLQAPVPEFGEIRDCAGSIAQSRIADSSSISNAAARHLVCVRSGGTST